GTLQYLSTLAMQHGMIWVGNLFLPEHHQGVPHAQAVNRLGSWSGLMAQAGHGAAADSFVAGDIKTARMFGQNFAETVGRVVDQFTADD
ncbi:MAG: flavodoxin family protein, partial [Pseudomonadota bacterium]